MRMQAVSPMTALMSAKRGILPLSFCSGGRLSALVFLGNVTKTGIRTRRVTATMTMTMTMIPIRLGNRTTMVWITVTVPIGPKMVGGASARSSVAVSLRLQTILDIILTKFAGCGWMGLPWGPGCPPGTIPPPLGELGFECGMFGCPDPDTGCIGLFGCPTINGPPVCGILGCGGHCITSGGCTPCPPEICKLPGCKLPDGCGPKPGPPPAQPSDRPSKCDDKQKITVTERFVWCTENIVVSSVISELQISSTTVSSVCAPLIQATVTGCAVVGWDSTTTATRTSTASETPGPMCTRAPLSLDDDEGSNEQPDRWVSSNSFTFSSMNSSTSTPSSPTKTTSSSASTTSVSCANCEMWMGDCTKKYCKQDGSDVNKCVNWCLTALCHAEDSPSNCRSGQTCAWKACPVGNFPNLQDGTPAEPFTWTVHLPSTIATVTNFPSSSEPSSVPAKPTRTSAPIKPDSTWKVKLRHTMERDDSSISWTLYDGNGFEAGKGMKAGHKSKELSDVIASQYRPAEDSMSYVVDLKVIESLRLELTQTELIIQKNICYLGDNIVGGEKYQCKPSMRTETFKEDKTFSVSVCESCKELLGRDPPLAKDDLWCDDLNKSSWKKKNAGWEREWECGWKGWEDAA
ncbi:hypothetical protein P153DRAFT_124095 [Dothidotthia symphoricarpi CBS 119687]|uniref:Uncharacterized protein n=1 Tax=Dothidotthia symphoricarpi CBS 119687 TaxID=1392245 RepID=A0A6A5ZYM9_9PLEO|nr:uncharacterized protein P153DRAFT_124095 [Dothidotthia symphoricarpi CBS 119687]KAF2124649.1 hypothetical protein P153DRAFT_124095 [Dothidotthia symphoricarpi CBS 119687]